MHVKRPKSTLGPACSPHRWRHSCGRRDDVGERIVRAVVHRIRDLLCESAVLHGPVEWDR